MNDDDWITKKLDDVACALAEDETDKPAGDDQGEQALMRRMAERRAYRQALAHHEFARRMKALTRPARDTWRKRAHMRGRGNRV